MIAFTFFTARAIKCNLFSLCQPQNPNTEEKTIYLKFACQDWGFKLVGLHCFVCRFGAVSLFLTLLARSCFSLVWIGIVCRILPPDHPLRWQISEPFQICLSRVDQAWKMSLKRLKVVENIRGATCISELFEREKVR